MTVASFYIYILWVSLHGVWIVQRKLIEVLVQSWLFVDEPPLATAIICCCVVQSMTVIARGLAQSCCEWAVRALSNCLLCTDYTL